VSGALRPTARRESEAASPRLVEACVRAGGLDVAEYGDGRPEAAEELETRLLRALARYGVRAGCLGRSPCG